MIYYESKYGVLYKGDCLEIMPSIQKKVDLVLTDPPYGTTQCKWDAIIPLDKMWSTIRSNDITCLIVLFASQPFSSVLVCSNLAEFYYEWVWEKSKITGVLNAKRMPVRQHEQILVFANKKARKTYNPQGLEKKGTITRQGRCSENYGRRKEVPYVQEFTNYPRDILRVSSEGKTLHPTQKPVELMEYLIKTYTNIGDTVLDFTIGSGTTAVAAINTGRKFIGIEMNEEYCEIAKQRIIEAEKKQEDLFGDI
jgi:site-specific DNA-methyltransferase (adenine-specific)